MNDCLFKKDLNTLNDHFVSLFITFQVEEVKSENDDEDILYHVTGDINSLYSEILINRICETKNIM